jgi:hypothetical protein
LKPSLPIIVYQTETGRKQLMDNVIGWLMLVAVTLGVGAVAVTKGGDVISALSNKVVAPASAPAPGGP